MQKYIAILTLLICTIFAGCTNPNHAIEVLSDNGYTDIQMTGYNFFACGQDDLYHTGFTAKGPTGKTINGTVCEGLLFKNATIRFK